MVISGICINTTNRIPHYKRGDCMTKLDRLRELAGVDFSFKKTKKAKKTIKESWNTPGIKSGAVTDFYVVRDPLKVGEEYKGTPSTIATLADIYHKTNMKDFIKYIQGGGSDLQHANVTIYPIALKAKAEEDARGRLSAAKEQAEHMGVKEGVSDDAQENSKSKKIKISEKAMSAIKKIIDDIAKKAEHYSTAKDHDLAHMYHKDARDYITILNYLKAGDVDSAANTWKHMDTAARDYTSDASSIHDIDTRRELAALLRYTLRESISPVNQDMMPSKQPSPGACPHCGAGVVPTKSVNQPPVAHLTIVSPEEEEQVAVPNTSSKFSNGQKVKHNGVDCIVEVPDAKGDLVGIVPVGQAGNKQAVKMVRASELEHTKETEDNKEMDKKVNEAVEKNLTDNKKVDIGKEEKAKEYEGSFPARDHEDKIKVPDSVKSSLKKAIKDADDQVKAAKIRNDDDSLGFYLALVDALKVLQDHLDNGTIGHLKMAQTDLTKLMSPMLHLVPVDVVDFIARGDNTQHISLKNLFVKMKDKNKE